MYMNMWYKIFIGKMIHHFSQMMKFTNVFHDERLGLHCTFIQCTHTCTCNASNIVVSSRHFYFSTCKTSSISSESMLLHNFFCTSILVACSSQVFVIYRIIQSEYRPLDLISTPIELHVQYVYIYSTKSLCMCMSIYA